MGRLKELGSIAAETWREWNDDDAMQWGAAVSYYAALSLAPLLVTLLSVVGLVARARELDAELVSFVGEWMGEAGARLAENVLADQQGGLFAGITSGVLALVGATAVFGQLQNALNKLWQVRGAGGLRRMLFTRVLGLLMVLCIGVVFLSALAMQAVLTALPIEGVLLRLAGVGGSLVLFTLLFAAVYQVLPDVEIRWRDVWVGAGVTAGLFVLGQFLVGLYLGRSAVGASYGAAGSLVAVLVWLYYSAQVFFFGAEFTQVWARRRGHRIVPTRGAYRVEVRRVEPETAADASGDGSGERGEPGDSRVGERGPQSGRGGQGLPGQPGRGRDHPPDPDKLRIRGGATYP